MKTYRISILAGAFCLLSLSSALADPLPSWKDSASKKSILEFVRKVSAANSPDFVPVSERIAVFDNDGTLWAEKPVYVQATFALERVRELASKHPEWKTEEPFASILQGKLDSTALHSKESLAKLIMATHAGMSSHEFSAIVNRWLDKSRHPKTGLRYTEMVYQPMLELLVYLRQHGFKTYIVSGGGVEFIRPWAARVYGIPPEQVIGSSIQLEYISDAKTPQLQRLPKLNFFNDKAGKPVAIQQYIGRRPLMAFGNSDGDFEMLEWTTAGTGPRFGLFVHHTDAQREWAYDRESHVGKLERGLEEAAQRGWTIVDMQNDWRTMFIPAHHYLHKSEKAHSAKWGYRGKIGPSHWGELSPEYALARLGKRQSPIDIPSAAVNADLPELHLKYKESKIHLIYNGHTIQENEDPGSFAMANGHRYELQQFHFHSPSEHTVDGNHFPMEMHLVHKSSTGSVAVVGLFIKEGKHNPAFNDIWDMLPQSTLPKRDADITIETSKLLPSNLAYFCYDGSFTTPPCTEHVKWIVLKEPVSLSKQQIERFRAVIDGNNRPVQPLNGRTVLYSGD